MFQVKRSNLSFIEQKGKQNCLSWQGVDIYWVSLLISYVYQEIIYAAEEMASCNWSPTSGEPGTTLVRLEWQKSGSWPAGAGFLLPICPYFPAEKPSARTGPCQTYQCVLSITTMNKHIVP